VLEKEAEEATKLAQEQQLTKTELDAQAIDAKKIEDDKKSIEIANSAERIATAVDAELEARAETKIAEQIVEQADLDAQGGQEETEANAEAEEANAEAVEANNNAEQIAQQADSRFKANAAEKIAQQADAAFKANAAEKVEQQADELAKAEEEAEAEAAAAEMLSERIRSEVEANVAEKIAMKVDAQVKANIAEKIEQEADEAAEEEKVNQINRANAAEKIAQEADQKVMAKTKKLKAAAALKARQAARFRELLYGTKTTKKDEKETMTDEEELAREGRALNHLRDEISQDLSEEAEQEEIRAHHEADLAQYAIDLAQYQHQLQAKQQERAKIEAGWIALKAAAHHLHDASTFLKEKEESLATQIFVDRKEGYAPMPTPNVETIVSPALADSAALDESAFVELEPTQFLEVNTQVKASRPLGEAHLMAKLKQLKSSTRV